MSAERRGRSPTDSRSSRLSTCTPWSSSHRAPSRFQSGPAVSAPLASQRCCQVLPRWSASQVTASAAPRNRQRSVPGLPTVRRRPAQHAQHLVPVHLGGRPAGRGRARRERGARRSPRCAAGLAEQLRRGRRGGGPGFLEPGGHEFPVPNSTCSVSGRYPAADGGPARCRALAHLLAVVGQHPADHVLRPRRQVKLRGGQLPVAEDGLHVGQRQSRILRHPVGGGVPQRMQRRRRPGLAARPLEHPGTA